MSAYGQKRDVSANATIRILFVPQSLQIVALFVLDGLAHLRNKQGDVLTAVNASASHGVLLYLLRKIVNGLDTDTGNLKATGTQHAMTVDDTLTFFFFYHGPSMPYSNISPGLYRCFLCICYIHHRISVGRVYGRFCGNRTYIAQDACQQAPLSIEGKWIPL